MSKDNFVNDTNYGRVFRICASGEVHFDGAACTCQPELQVQTHPVADLGIDPFDPTVSDGAYARPQDPDTSKVAAATVNSAALEALVVDALRSNPDSSIQDVVEITCERYRSISPATCVQTGESWFSAELSAELDKLEYPLHFMDFETVNPAIPRFAGMRPYDQLPFQWSAHVQREPGSTLEHHEFLANDSGDPRREFITSLCEALGEGGSIVVYNASFESGRLLELATWLPDFAHRIQRIQRRLWDLLPVVRAHVYHPAFAGSYSLKAVLPALVPEMTYGGMEVANGQDAGLAWELVVRGAADLPEREKVRKALFAYCRLDTLALVRILGNLRGRAVSPNRD